MGPMRASCRFASELAAGGVMDRVARVQAELYGSLALTGLGHATDRAVLLGLAGNEPAAIDPATIDSTVAAIRFERRIHLAGKRNIPFEESSDLVFHRDQMFPPGAQTRHPNGLRLSAFDRSGGIDRVSGRSHALFHGAALYPRPARIAQDTFGQSAQGGSARARRD